MADDRNLTIRHATGFRPVDQAELRRETNVQIQQRNCAHGAGAEENQHIAQLGGFESHGVVGVDEGLLNDHSV